MRKRMLEDEHSKRMTETEREGYEQERNRGLHSNEIYCSGWLSNKPRPCHTSATLFCSPLFSTYLFSSISVFMLRPCPQGLSIKSKRDPSVLAKKPCWLINKGGGWIRKLNHLGLLMSQPADGHEIHPVPLSVELLCSPLRLYCTTTSPDTVWWAS